MPSQFIASNTQAIALYSFAYSYEPLLKFPALRPAAVPLALPLIVLPMAPTPEALDDADPVLTLYPAGVPRIFSPMIRFIAG